MQRLPTRGLLSVLSFVAGLVAVSGQLMVPPNRMVQRAQDVLTGLAGNLTAVFTIPQLPVYMGAALAGTSVEGDVLADMTWTISTVTGMVQLQPLVPTKYVYLQQHNAVVGGIWWQHHDAFAKLIAKHGPRHVIEVGGGHGYLATKLLIGEKVASWTMVDPNPDHIFQLPTLKVIKGYFETVRKLPPNVDAVVHSHTLEHIYEPAAFFAQLQRLLAVGSYHIFSTPDMLSLAMSDAPTLHFEHSILMY